MPSLFIRCHRCRSGFASGIARDKGVSGHLLLVGVLERCPRCGHLSRYNTPEFFVPIVPPSDDGGNGAHGSAPPAPAPSESRPRSRWANLPV